MKNRWRGISAMDKLGVLSKELCKRCHNEYFTNPNFRWSEDDEAMWKKDFVYCPYEYDDNDETPPIDCPYRLEHMMKTQKKPMESSLFNE